MPVLGTHQILPVEKLRELLKRLNPQESVAANALSSEAEEGLLALADDFIHRATHSACLLAQHRTSNTLEVQDLRLLQVGRLAWAYRRVPLGLGLADMGLPWLGVGTAWVFFA